ncbi:hypothetical protein [Neorhodopirellula pilleata]|uniref:Uncharacterized protein n=1 Tax=Neorhodopirellula pilleata TaxID=2714738 RepID=A0A5C5YQH9_9BACT|nr:hypothetical protein [Neorhodopirellula pilleata]TWT77166.1 hypothetical protein Pla100_63390 [Neorhodopirellula pilleata]
MTNATIDLRPIRDLLSVFLKETCRSFTDAHPDVGVSTVALYVFPYSRIAGLCFDHQFHSDASVSEWQHKGPDWYGEDNAGLFCNSPADFAFPDFAEFELSSFPDLYDCDNRLLVCDLNGDQTAVDRNATGDEGVNKAVFPAFCDLLREFDGWASLRTTAPFRIGVVMHDSTCQTFWQHENG